MQKIQIFQSEIDDGVADAVRSQASVAYCLPATDVRVVKDPEWAKKTDLKALAENQDQSDLYYLETVLVSTNWNSNDDVFLPGPTWAARHTPEDKQFNFMHNEDDIIGHITGSYVVDKNGNRIQADSDDSHPDYFDIVTRVVLYNSWGGEENRERMDKIIAEIESDEELWFVSMECLFGGFDYALKSMGSSEEFIIQRNEESAFLTKHLRAYGGDGEYDGHRVARALQRINFSGEGLVDNPANSKSTILDRKKVVAFTVDDNAKSTIGESKMTEAVVKEQLEALKSELATARAENAAFKAQAEEAKDKAVADQIASHEEAIAEKDGIISGLEDAAKVAEAKIAELEKSLSDANDSIAKFEENEEKMKKEKKDEKRKAELVEAGVDVESADVAPLFDLEDDAFASVLEIYKAKTVEASSEEDGDADDSADASDDTDSDEESAEASDALEDTDTDEDVAKGSGSDEEVDALKQEMVDFVASAMNYTK